MWIYDVDEDDFAEVPDEPEPEDWAGEGFTTRNEESTS